MKTIIVTTQAELDALPSSFAECTEVYIEGGTPSDRIVVRQTYSGGRVVARGSSHVEARDSSHVVARGSSHVEARGSSHVVARDSSHVVAWDSSHVEARDSSHVVAWDSVAVHNRSSYTALELASFAVAFLIVKTKSVKKVGKNCRTIVPKRTPGVKGWLEDEAVKAEHGSVVLFKRVSSDLKTREGTENETTWSIGADLTVPGWDPDGAECGPGKFHACSRPYFCDEFRDKPGDRYVAIKIAVKDLRAWENPEHPHKIAFRRGVVLHECDRHGRKIG